MSGLRAAGFSGFMAERVGDIGKKRKTKSQHEASDRVGKRGIHGRTIFRGMLPTDDKDGNKNAHETIRHSQYPILY